MNLVKAQIPLGRVLRVSPFLLRFVSRQSEFAFFGALTTVGALFIFRRITMKKTITIILALLMFLCLFGCQNKDVREVNCRNCNERIDTAAKYCPNCGKSQDILVGENNSKDAKSETTVEETVTPVPTTSNCVKCGAVCELNHSYCSNHECTYSHCVLPVKSGSSYCDSHACLLCKKVRCTGSAYCIAHTCSNCNNASVGKSKFCSAHKCLLCDKEAWSSGYCSKHEP